MDEGVPLVGVALGSLLGDIASLVGDALLGLLLDGRVVFQHVLLPHWMHEVLQVHMSCPQFGLQLRPGHREHINLHWIVTCC